MKSRLVHLALALAALTGLSSCGAAGSLYQQADRMVQAVSRTVTGGQ